MLYRPVKIGGDDLMDAATISLSLSLLLGLILLYLLKRHADRLEGSDRRIIDLLIVGFLISVSQASVECLIGRIVT